LENKVVAIVPAAGIGERFGKGTNKPFSGLADKPLIIWVVETLQSIPEIVEIIPVVKERDIKLCSLLMEDYSITKVKRIAPGGSERQDSVFHGLSLIHNKDSVVLVHDGVRPLIEPSVITGALQQLPGFDGVVVGVPLKDTVKEVRDSLVVNTLKRDLFWAVQTPQIFYYQALHNAYEKAMADLFYSTDDSALVERNGGRIKMVQGSYTNIKVTTPEDLLVAEAFLKMKAGEL
jgi:2-C-methyl-D-erythritol 4-phosphate cytidylyltransferase